MIPPESDEGDADILVGGLGNDDINGRADDDLIFAHEHRGLLADVIAQNPEIERALPAAFSVDELALIADQLAAEIERLEDREAELVAISLVRALTDAEADELEAIPEMTAVLDARRRDLADEPFEAVDKLIGGPGDDSLFGSPFADEFFGDDGNDHFYAGTEFGATYQPDDIFNGDLAASEPWIDTKWFDASERGDDIFVVPYRATTNEPYNAAVAIGDRATVIGSVDVEREGVDQIGVRAGDGEDNVIVDFADPDEPNLQLALARVIVDAGTGDDTVDASAINSVPIVVHGGSGDDDIAGGHNADVLYGDAGDDEIHGGAGSDTADGGSGNDTILGGTGADTLIGGPGNDLLQAGADLDADQLFGNTGADSLLSGAGSDLLDGGLGPDTIDAANGSNHISWRSDGDLIINDTNAVFNHHPFFITDDAQVNTSIAGFQNDAKTALLPDGGFVTTWQGQDPATSNVHVYFQRYSASGLPLGVETKVDSLTGDSRSPDIAAFSDGGFVVIWKNEPVWPDNDIYLQLYDPEGIPIGSHVQVSYDTPQLVLRSTPAITSLSNDAFIAIWTDQGGTYGRKYNSDGQPQGIDFLVDASFASNPDAVATDSGFAVAWWGLTDNSRSDASGRLFNRDGIPITDRFVVSESTEDIQSSTVVTTAPNNDLLFAWADDGVYTRRFRPDGTPASGELRVDIGGTEGDGRRPAIASQPDGSYIIAWESDTSDAGVQLYARNYNYLDVSQAPPFAVNGNSAGDQQQVDVVALASGDYRFTWWDRSGQDGDGDGVFSRRLNASAPQVLDVSADQSSRTIRVRTSEPLMTVADGSALDVSNWILTQHANGARIPIRSVRADTLVASTSSDSFLLEYTSSLAPGDYELRVSDAIQDLGGAGIDGNYDEMAGGSLIATFSVAAAPISLGAPSDTVNGTTMGHELAINKVDGSFVVVWQADGELGDSNIYSQRFDAGGQPLGESFVVSTFTQEDQIQPDIAMNEVGDFVIVWDSEIPLADGHVVSGRRFAADGTPIDAVQLEIDTTPRLENTRPRVSMRDDGEVAVTWRAVKLDGAEEILTRRLPAGATLGAIIEVASTSAPTSLGDPDIVINDQGDFTVVWDSHKQEESLVVTVFSDDFEGGPRPEWGNQVGSWQVTNGEYEAAAPGTFPIIYSGLPFVLSDFTVEVDIKDIGDGGIWLRASHDESTDKTSGVLLVTVNDELYWHIVIDDVTGPILGQVDGLFTPDVSDPHLRIEVKGDNYDVFVDGSATPATSLTTSQFASGRVGVYDNRLASQRFDNFTITTEQAIPASHRVSARRFSASDVVEAEFDIDAAVTSSGGSARVAMNADGEQAVVWVGQFDDGFAVLAQRFDPEGRRIGIPFAVSDTSVTPPESPDVAVDSEGNLALAWIDDGEHVRWFDKGGNVLSDELRIGGDSGPFDATAANPSIVTGPDGDLLVAWTSSGPTGGGVVAQRFTVASPTVLSATPDAAQDQIVIPFSQEMALSGAGSAMDLSNWALRLPDGRFIIPDPTPNDESDDYLSTLEQFAGVTQVYQAETGVWDVTLELAFPLLPGDYQLVARSTLEDAAGRRLDGDASGAVAESHVEDFTIDGIVVGIAEDVVNNDLSPTDLSLREAIGIANASSIPRRIVFDSTLDGETILLDQTLGTVAINASMVIDASSLPSGLTVDGDDGGDGVFDSGDGFSVIRVDDGTAESLIDVELAGLTIRGGDSIDGGGVVSEENLTLTGVTLAENAASNRGGGLFARGATLISDSTLSSNRSGRGGGLYSEGALETAGTAFDDNHAVATVGGGLASLGSVQITGGSFTGNSSALDGGALWVEGSLDVERAVIDGNMAGDDGGGVFATTPEDSDMIAVHGSTLRNNTSLFDGGAVRTFGSITVTDSTVEGNYAGRTGGGLRLTTDSAADDVLLQQVTVSGNRADRDAGGVYIRAIEGAGAAAIRHSTITLNRANDDFVNDGTGGGVVVAELTNLRLDHTIVAGNLIDSSGAAADITGDSSALSGLALGVIDVTYSIIGDNLGSMIPESQVREEATGWNLIGERVDQGGAGVIDPLLGPLGDNGGPTETHALLGGSPAIDGGEPAFDPMALNPTPTHDQRGAPFERVVDGSGGGIARIDVGAFEVSDATLLSGDANSDGVVDLLDLDILGTNFGISPATFEQGDFNADAVVDLLDLDILGAEFGANSTASATGFAAATASTSADRGAANDAAFALFADAPTKIASRSLRFDDVRPELRAPFDADLLLLALADIPQSDDRTASVGASRKGDENAESEPAVLLTLGEL